MFTGFKVYGVYLVGSTVAIGFFRHCWSRIHDTAALQEVRIQFLVDGFQKLGFWSPHIWYLGPMKGKSCTKPSYVMCSQCLIRSGYCVLKELVLCSLGFKLVENSRFKKEKKCYR